MKKENSTICFRWLIYPTLTFILGATLSCAGMISDFGFKGADLAPPEEEMPEMEVDVIQEAYRSFTMASIQIANGRYEEQRHIYWRPLAMTQIQST